MATAKKPSRARKPTHGGAEKDHEVTVHITLGPIGPLTRIPGKGPKKLKRGSSPKQVKEFLRWVLTQI